MDKKLPFVWRNTGRAITDSSKLRLTHLATSFMLSGDGNNEFLRYERHWTLGDPSAILIVLPGKSFYKNGQTYRSDIRWMWKFLSQNDGRIEVGHKGYLFLFVTDEPQYYSPGPDVIKGSFADAELLWKWIEYVTTRSWYKQKGGQLRGMFAPNDDVPTMLKKVSERLISGDP